MASAQWEELAGSPKIHLDRSGGSATRRFKLPWGDIQLFAQTALPSPPGFNPTSVATVPGYPWLLAHEVDFEPLGDLDPDSNCSGSSQPPNAMNSYTDAGNHGAVATVQYAPPTIEQGMGGQDASGPGGNEGSDGSGNGKNMQHSVHISGTFLAFPAAGVIWHEKQENHQLTGVTYPFVPKDDKGLRVKNDPHAGKIIVQVEHTISQLRVPFPPWAAIREKIGHVNAATYAGAPPETMLFLGCEAQWHRAEVSKSDPTDTSCWIMQYKFTEKNQNNGLGEAAAGWNHYYRTLSGQFERIVRIDATRIYRFTLFDSLFGVGII